MSAINPNILCVHKNFTTATTKHVVPEHFCLMMTVIYTMHVDCQVYMYFGIPNKYQIITGVFTEFTDYRS